MQIWYKRVTVGIWPRDQTYKDFPVFIAIFSSAGVRGLVWLNFENRILDLASMEIEKYVTRKFCLVINFEHYDLIVPYQT